MSDSFFLFSAYVVIWIILFGYVLYLLNKQKEVRKELDMWHFQ